MLRVEANDGRDNTDQQQEGPSALRDPARLMRGAVLAGKYRLELPLGEGGMAVVWSAYHLELEIPVAIKLLRVGHDPQHAQRLKREARAAARIAHPAIVRVLDVAATEDGEPFIVMEMLTGETLADALARGNMSALRVVQLLLPIVEALALVHGRGVVHRDLKPENVLLAMDGDQLQPKLLDFGIARLTGGEPAVRLTQNGMTLGSPSYMSPEQVRGEQVDYRSDIWSFCVLLYKAIGGKAPFRGASARETLDAILEREPPPLPIGTGVDGHLARIVLSGLSKEPAARPASMRQLGQQLARWLLLHGVSVDACGAPLAAKWLSRAAPMTPRACASPARLGSALPPSRPPPPSSKKRYELTTQKLTCVEPVGQGNELVVAREPPSRIPKPRRWVLWALAGVLLAGGSLALTRQDGPEARTLRPSSASALEPRLLSVDTELAAPEPSPTQPLALRAPAASTLSRAPIEGGTPTATPRPAVTAALGVQPAKSPAPAAARPKLPF